MKDRQQHRLRKRQRRLNRRLNRKVRPGRNGSPVLGAGPARYEFSDRVVATKAGGLGAVHGLARRLRLPELIDARLALLKRHLPYHESDHVLSIAYSYLAGGRSLQDLDLLREDEALMNMLGAERLPDPTTAGDFLRRFTPKEIDALQDLLNEKRVGIWQAQAPSFRRRAVIDADGTVAESTGEKKYDMDYNAHKKTWGYHPLLVSLANTREPLFLVNRPGNVPSHADAAAVFDKAIDLTEPVFDEILLRGDTDFSLTVNFDRWSERGVKFVFGYDAHPNLVQLANKLGEQAWKPLVRPSRLSDTAPRSRRPNVKEQRVEEKGWKNLVLQGEQLAEFEYQPRKCSRTYRMVVVRKEIEEREGQQVLVTNYRYLFYVTNAPDFSAEEVVRQANQRCEQENLIEQLKNGVPALRLPSHDLTSNWAHMVIGALAWSLKAWFALTLPRVQDRQRVLLMEFRTFLNTIVLVPAQVLRKARRLVIRLLAVTSLVRLLFSSTGSVAGFS